MDIISPMIDKARGFLEAGEKLQPMAFVGNLTTKEVIPVMVQTGSEEGKDQSARTIQSAALALEADFVFAIMEAWTLHRHATAAVCGSCASTKNPCRTITPALAFSLPRTTLEAKARFGRCALCLSIPTPLQGASALACADR